VIQAFDGDIWIVPRGLACFDFAARLPARYADLARQPPDVDDVIAVAAGFTTLERADGARRAVLLIGAEPEAGRGFPFPRPDDPARPDAVAIDASNADMLGARSLPASLAVGGQRALAIRHVHGFGSFLGSPYVFTGYRDARRMLAIRPDDASFLVVRAKPQAPIDRLVGDLRRRLPEVDVLSRDAFARRSATFWLAQTGAGGGILVAALLGFVVGFAITSQTLYASTMERVDEFATLKAIGAPNHTLAALVTSQAIVLGALGAVVGAAATAPLVTIVRGALVPWIATPWFLYFCGPVVGIAMSTLGSLASVRRVTRVDAALVFRR
jgi:putative ABC transport system permease protein